MPSFTLFATSECPHPATQSSVDSKLSLRNYVVQIKAPLARKHEYIFAFVTEQTGYPVFGDQAISDMGLSPEGESELTLVDDDHQHQYKLRLTITPAKPGGTVSSDYMQIGWKTIEDQFDISEPDQYGNRDITAKEAEGCQNYHSH